jgi:RNA polymerase sigma factor (sigma-70 family)
MLNRQQKVILPQLCRLIGSPSGGDLSDGELLERFLARRDAEAFAALVRRHGPTVLGVCRRVLRDGHDAEDAFQATFLVLAERARSIGRREALGSWLYGVAYRVALRARTDAARRRRHEGRAATGAEAVPGHDPTWDDVRPVLDEEVSRLPDKYRRPVVLCYFEGKTYQEAARLLGCPAGTASVRLARARELLRTRLALRGLALSSCALAVGLAEGTTSAAEASLLAVATAGAAVLWLADPAAAGVSTQVIALTQGVVKEMFARKVKALAGIVLVVAVAAGGAGALSRFAAPAPVAAAEPASPPTAEPTRPAEAPPRALAPPAGEGARPPQTHVGLINITRALKGSKKFQAAKSDLDARTKESQKKVEALKKQLQEYQAHYENHPPPPATRDQAEERIRQMKRAMEDETESARSRLNKASNDAVTAAYREVEGAADRVAKLKGLELVLFYTDAVTEEDFYNPANLQRKLSQPGALMPMIVAPGMDVTDAVIEALNRAPAEGPRP